MSPVLPSARALFHLWAKIIRPLLFTLALTSTAQRATAASEGVSVPANFVVAHGKLQLAWKNSVPEPALVALHHSDAAIAATFKERVLADVNASLSVLNPMLDWKPELGATPDQPLRSQLPAADRSDAENFSGPLRDWLARFAGSSGGTFVHWRPTEPARTAENGEPAESETVHDSLTSFLVLSATSLIGQISVSDLEDNNPLEGAPVRVRFHAATPLAGVRIAGLEFAPETAHDDAERAEFAQHQRERAIVETELSHAAGGLQLSWNDDLAVQRMMNVFRARGWWNGFAAAQPGAPRQVPWLTFDDDQTHAIVHPPHLAYLVFEPGADSDELVAATVTQLLRPREQAVIDEILALQRRFPAARDAPRESQPLIRIVQRREQRRVVDLFALGSFLGAKSADGKTLRSSPLPVREEWLAARFSAVEARSVVIVGEPAGTNENRLFSSRNRSRREFERGGIEIWISPRGVEKSDATADPARAADAAQKNGLGDWIKRQRLRLEAGVSLEDAEPATVIARVSTIDADALGQLGAELRFQKRLSGKIEWQPLATNTAAPGLLPSNVSLFSDTPPERPIDGHTVSFVHEGVRLSQRRAWTPRDSGRSSEGWFEFGAEAARVRDLTPLAQPAQDEFSVSAGAGFHDSPNVWDARAYRALRVKATATARGRDAFDSWILLEAAGQIRVPRGDWSYFGSFDARTVTGSPAPDALPYIGGSEGVRGVRPYAAPARTVIVVRNELWTPVPFLTRDIGSDQKWFRTVYQTVKPALFLDTGWASSLHDPSPTSPWFFGPGAGIRVLLGPAHLSLDYAYGLTHPARLGGHRLSLGITARY